MPAILLVYLLIFAVIAWVTLSLFGGGSANSSRRESARSAAFFSRHRDPNSATTDTIFGAADGAADATTAAAAAALAARDALSYAHDPGRLQLPHKALLSLLERHCVTLPVRAATVRVLHHPAEFYEVLKSMVRGARRSVLMTALYVGDGPLSRGLVECLTEKVEAMAAAGKPFSLVMVLDYNRMQDRRNLTTVAALLQLAYKLRQRRDSHGDREGVSPSTSPHSSSSLSATSPDAAATAAAGMEKGSDGNGSNIISKKSAGETDAAHSQKTPEKKEDAKDSRHHNGDATIISGNNHANGTANHHSANKNNNNSSNTANNDSNSSSNTINNNIGEVTVELHLYQNASKWNNLFAPLSRAKEALGVQHTKIFCFDDADTLLTGANLSDDYFASRMDRYVVIRDNACVARFFTALAQTLVRVSHPVLCRQQFEAEQERYRRLCKQQQQQQKEKEAKKGAETDQQRELSSPATRTRDHSNGANNNKNVSAAGISSSGDSSGGDFANGLAKETNNNNSSSNGKLGLARGSNGMHNNSAGSNSNTPEIPSPNSPFAMPLEKQPQTTFQKALRAAKVSSPTAIAARRREGRRLRRSSSPASSFTGATAGGGEGGAEGSPLSSPLCSAGEENANPHFSSPSSSLAPSSSSSIPFPHSHSGCGGVSSGVQTPAAGSPLCSAPTLHTRSDLVIMPNSTGADPSLEPERYNAACAAAMEAFARQMTRDFAGVARRVLATQEEVPLPPAATCAGGDGSVNTENNTTTTSHNGHQSNNKKNDANSTHRSASGAQTLQPNHRPTAEKNDEEGNGDGGYDSVLFPTVQFAHAGVYHDSFIVSEVLRLLQGADHVYLTSPYLNLHPDFTQRVLEGQCRLDCITASVRTNGWRGQKGIAGHIPFFYLQLERSFYFLLKAYGCARRFRLHEFAKEGLTFHAKGMWFTSATEGVSRQGSEVPADGETDLIGSTCNNSNNKNDSRHHPGYSETIGESTVKSDGDDNDAAATNGKETHHRNNGVASCNGNSTSTTATTTTVAERKTSPPPTDGGCGGGGGGAAEAMSLLSAETPFMAVYGSTNYGYRSVHRDVEAAALLYTGNGRLRAELRRELTGLLAASETVAEAQFFGNAMGRFQPVVSLLAQMGQDFL